MNEDDRGAVLDIAAAVGDLADAVREGAQKIADAIREPPAEVPERRPYNPDLSPTENAAAVLREKPCEPGSVVGATCRRGTTGCPLPHDDD